jgi:hypothetical protein
VRGQPDVAGRHGVVAAESHVHGRARAAAAAAGHSVAPVAVPAAARATLRGAADGLLRIHHALRREGLRYGAGRPPYPSESTARVTRL